MTRTLTLVAALMLGSAALGHQITIGDLEFVHPRIPTPFAGAKSAAGYTAIVNSGSEADRLIGVRADFADSTMLHLAKTSADGIATMTHVEALHIPSGETVVLEPGGYHVMFMGLTQSLPKGAMLPVILTFERAGEVAVEFMVDPPGEDGASHAGHGTGG